MRRSCTIIIALAAITGGCRSPQPAPAASSTASPPPAERLPASIAEATALRGDAERYSRALQHLTRSSDATTARYARVLVAFDRAASGDVSLSFL